MRLDKQNFFFTVSGALTFHIPSICFGIKGASNYGGKNKKGGCYFISHLKKIIFVSTKINEVGVCFPRAEEEDIVNLSLTGDGVSFD